MSKKPYFEKITKKQFWLLRVLIYFFAFFLILYFLLSNTLKVEVGHFNPSEIEERDDYLVIKHFSSTDYPMVNLSLKLKNEVSENSNDKEMEIKAIRTLSPLTRERGETITKKDDLKEKLQISEDLPFHNGDMISAPLGSYYIERGKALKIANKYFSKSFISANKQNGNKSSTFLDLEQGEPINSERIYSDLDFPRDLILKSDGKFFITGKKTIDPIFSEKLIKKINPNFQYISGHSPVDKNLKNMHCNKIKESGLNCFTELQKNPDKTFSNVYYFEMKNINLTEIEEVILKFETKSDFKSRLIKVKDLLW